MYASQWFLTLFAAKFPLHLVFRIMDLFLYEGSNALLAVALALLKRAQKYLIILDFEGIMRYFRVTLPKKYRYEKQADELIHAAYSVRINDKKLKHYEKEYYEMKAANDESDELLNRFKSDDHIETLTRELNATRTMVRDSELDTIRLNEEIENSDSQLNDELEKQTNIHTAKVENMQNRLDHYCDSCKLLLVNDNTHKSSLASIPSSLSQHNALSSSNNSITTSDHSSSTADHERRLSQVEVELAEALRENQQLIHQLQTLAEQKYVDYNSISSNIRRQPQQPNLSVNNWLNKTVNTIKAATRPPSGSLRKH
ncbi:unnamed protein product [Didymodactylos carnosus]|uniref:Rab-GAP TBC domain-containing protein n=1 Tax=Didymodactylos carnosus TaxID=1234261 RepID=A0A815YKZ1_9BILA|nr:unnamed protein product [Didymodactylos carnosus]CAF4435884.1 unnamed protein product [Didymodactylos carnosus]